MEQKRKWCQEIKTLILESYKEKIPEKVKGLVMQLGKSKDEGMFINSEIAMVSFLLANKLVNVTRC